MEPQGAATEMPYAMDRQISLIAFLLTTQLCDATLHLSSTDKCMKLCINLIAGHIDNDGLCCLRAFCSDNAAGEDGCKPGNTNTARLILQTSLKQSKRLQTHCRTFVSHRAGLSSDTLDPVHSAV